MAIAFSQIPANLLVPGQYQEIDNSRAGVPGELKRALIVAYKRQSGTAAAGVAVNVLSEAKAAELCGHGSPAAIGAAAFLSINQQEQLYILPIAEPAAGTAWSKRCVISAAMVGAGSLGLTINGSSVAIAIRAGMSPAEIAAAVIAACNSMPGCPVEASLYGEGIASPTTVELSFTACCRGLGGNATSVQLHAAAPGLSIGPQTITPGSGTPDLSALGAMLGEQRWHYIVFDFDDPASVKAVADELESRYSATRQIGGRAFIALSGVVGSATEPGSLLAQAEAVNSPHLCVIPRGVAPELPIQWSARFAAAACRILADDPSANTYDTRVPGLAPERQYDFKTRQKLLEAGIATWRLDSVGAVLIERLVTSYTENSDGGRDTSYLDIQVVETVDAVRSYINAEARARFKTWKLASTEENFGSGAKVMTPGIWRSFLADLYQTVFIQQKNWCQNFEAYKKSIIVEVKLGDKTRLEYRHEPVLIGQFLVGAGLNQFR